MNFQQQTHIHRSTNQQKQQQQYMLPEPKQQQQKIQHQEPNIIVVPGNKTYDQATSTKEVTTIATDSLCRSIRVKQFN